jgi:hypothetical protein
MIYKFCQVDSSFFYGILPLLFLLFWTKYLYIKEFVLKTKFENACEKGQCYVIKFSQICHEHFIGEQKYIGDNNKLEYWKWYCKTIVWKCNISLGHLILEIKCLRKILWDYRMKEVFVVSLWNCDFYKLPFLFILEVRRLRKMHGDCR